MRSRKELDRNNKLNLKYGEKRNYYSCNNTNNYLSYVEKGVKEKDYINYSGDEKKSAGIFNSKGLLSKEEVNQLKQNLKATTSPIWHGIITFEEVFGKEYCGTYKQAYELMKTQFSKFLKNAKFNVSNVEWFAGLHTNTEHRHIHFSFYEKQPQKKRYNKDGLYFSKGKVNQFSINRLKSDFELKLLSDKTILKERDMLIKNAKNILGTGIGKELYKDIERLINILPKNGKLSYSSDNLKPYRKEIDKVSKRFINSNKELSNEYFNVYVQAMKVDEQIMEVFGFDENKYKYHLRHDKYINDVNARIGNLILKFIKELEENEFKKQINNKRLQYQYKNRLVEKRIKKTKRKQLINKMNYLNDLVNKEVMYYFEELMNKLRQFEHENLLKQKQSDDFEM